MLDGVLAFFSARSVAQPLPNRNNCIFFNKSFAISLKSTTFAPSFRYIGIEF